MVKKQLELQSELNYITNKKDKHKSIALGLLTSSD